MPLSPVFMRAFLLTGLVSMLALAIVFLTKRKLPVPSVIGWGALAVLVPLVGPFLVILAHPGGRLSRLTRLERRRLRRLRRMPHPIEYT